MAKNTGALSTKNGKRKAKAASELEINGILARALSSTNWHTRDDALQQVLAALRFPTTLSEEDARNLWKGLFYTFWHSDKGPVQEALADKLSGAAQNMKPEVQAEYFRVFFQMLREEWQGIDRLRLDKFLMLARKFVRQAFSLCLGSPAAQASLQPILGSQVIVQDRTASVGTALHYADIMLEELQEAASPRPIPAAAWALLLQPAMEGLGCPNLALCSRIQLGVFEPLLSQTSKQQYSQCNYGKVGEQLFDQGAATGTTGRVRAMLYALSKRFKQAHARRCKSGAFDSEPAPSDAQPDADGAVGASDAPHQPAAAQPPAKRSKRAKADGPVALAQPSGSLPDADNQLQNGGTGGLKPQPKKARKAARLAASDAQAPGAAPSNGSVSASQGESEQRASPTAAQPPETAGVAAKPAVPASATQGMSKKQRKALLKQQRSQPQQPPDPQPASAPANAPLPVTPTKPPRRAAAAGSFLSTPSAPSTPRVPPGGAGPAEAAEPASPAPALKSALKAQAARRPLGPRVPSLKHVKFALKRNQHFGGAEAPREPPQVMRQPAGKRRFMLAKRGRRR